MGHCLQREPGEAVTLLLCQAPHQAWLSQTSHRKVSVSSALNVLSFRVLSLALPSHKFKHGRWLERESGYVLVTELLSLLGLSLLSTALQYKIAICVCIQHPALEQSSANTSRGRCVVGGYAGLSPSLHPQGTAQRLLGASLTLHWASCPTHVQNWQIRREKETGSNYISPTRDSGASETSSSLFASLARSFTNKSCVIYPVFFFF